MGRKNKKKTTHHRQVIQYKGILEITRSGMGFVLVQGLEKDVFVKPNDFNRAFHGDMVRVEITRGDQRAGRLQGKIIQVIERKQKEFFGNIEVNRDFAFFIPDTDRPVPDFYIPLHALNGAKDGQRVLVRMTQWDEGDKRPKGEVVELVDALQVGDLAMKEILVQQGFSVSFSDEVMEEAIRISSAVTEEDVSSRRDCRGLLTFTIDPEDAKDFDDALGISDLGNGMFEIAVHIADVSHYMQADSFLDQSAYERATSVYLPDRVVPMLPERLSNELCSLRPHEDKLTFSCIFKIDNKGLVHDKWIGRTLIHSNHRFTYEDVQKTIDTGEGLYEKEILLLHNMAQSMRRNRMKNGAINFNTQEVRFRLDENGKPLGIVIKESKASHQLIEEFMLLANRTVAEYVSSIMVERKPLPFPYRIHDQPDEEKLVPFVEFARKFGYHFSTKTPNDIASSFNEMLSRVKGLPEQHVLEQMGIRTMSKAMYTSKNIGHFGLGFEYYCHFTSPIRRYPDVLVHRILAEVLKGSPIPDKKLEQKCIHSSERERAAMEAERSANKYKQVEYMRDFLGEEFDAVVSGVSGFGFWAETVAHKCEGLVSVASLSDYDDFIYHEKEYALVGKRSGWAFRIGDAVKIKVVAANLSKRQLDYEWMLGVESLEKHSTRSKKK